METKEMLKKQIIKETKDPQYRIFLHRTYTGDLGIADADENCITQQILRSGLKVFGDRNIEFTLTDSKNDSNFIMQALEEAHNYKASDKVFLIKLPIEAVEYKEGYSKPVLVKTDETNQHGNETYIIPNQYILGYTQTPTVGTGIIYNPYKNEKVQSQEGTYFTSKVTSQYRKKNEERLKSIRGVEFYTPEEKTEILSFLLSKQNISSKLRRKIEKVVSPRSSIKANSNNLEYIYIAENVYKTRKGKKLTVKDMEEEFSKPRKMYAKEISKAIPCLINEENIRKKSIK